MPKLPRLTARELIKFLEAHGFLLDHTTGSHFVFYKPMTRRRAVVPRHKRDLPVGTILAILRETGFTRDDIIKSFQG